MATIILWETVKFFKTQFVQFTNLSELSMISLQDSIKPMQDILPHLDITTYNNDGHIDMTLVALMTIYYVTSYLPYITYGFAVMLCLCGAYSIYEIVSYLNDTLHNGSKPTTNDDIMKQFKDCHSCVSKINEGIQYVFLYVFTTAVLTAAWNLFFVIDGQLHIIRRLFFVFCDIFVYTTLWVAAKCVQKVFKI